MSDVTWRYLSKLRNKLHKSERFFNLDFIFLFFQLHIYELLNQQYKTENITKISGTSCDYKILIFFTVTHQIRNQENSLVLLIKVKRYCLIQTINIKKLNPLKPDQQTLIKTTLQ